MELTEHVASYLRQNGFNSATSGIMPPSPDKCVAVFASGIRQKHDEDGSRFQVIVRSEIGADTALSDIMAIINLLEDFSGIMSADENAPYFARIVLETGAASLGEDNNGRLLYSANFNAFYC